jgi:hypothetical protein
MKKYDRYIAVIFCLLTVLFFVISYANYNFLSWVFERHQNQLSWFIRPIFIIPFCFFAYKHSWACISITIFCLFTSMFWFNKPDIVNDDVKQFLQFEKDWLNSELNFRKVLLILSVPVSFTALGLAFWKRSLWIGLAVVILVAVGKIIWSIHNAGQSGKSIVLPAIIGMIICCGLIYYGFKRIEKKKNKP